MENFCVYILKSEKTGKFYCGQTNNFEDRFRRHNSGFSKATRSGIPWEVVKVIDCSSRSEAVVLEHRIKKRGIKRFLNDIEESG